MASSATSEIAPLFADAPAAPDYFNVLLYGPPGSGKSTAAATSPGPIVWINAEGRNSMAFARKVARERGTTIREVRLEAGTDPRPQLKDAERYLQASFLPDAEERVGTVVIDTMGKLRDLLADVMISGNEKRSRMEWGQINKVLGPLVETLRDMPCNVVIVAHEDIDGDAEDRIIRPAIGGKLTEGIPGDMDVVAYCGVVVPEDGPTRYMGQLVERRGRRAKDRSGGLGRARDLDLTEWLSAFQAALGGGEADMPWAEKAA